MACQTGQFNQSYAAIQHAAVARKLDTIKHRSGYRIRHGKRSSDKSGR